MNPQQSAPKDSRIVVYTAIFGPEDRLREPRVLSPNIRFVCLTDQPFRSTAWEIKKIAPPVAGDMQRSNRFCKLFPNIFFPEHEYSIYIDGNMLVREDPSLLISEYLADANIAFFSHKNIVVSPIDCIYDEAELIFDLMKKGTRKDDPAIISAQMKFYHDEGYPAHNGLISGMVIVRRHNAPDVVSAMGVWWKMLHDWSRRDQLSFNYVAWKLGLRVAYMSGDSTDNVYFLRMAHRLPFWRQARLYLKAALRRATRFF